MHFDKKFFTKKGVYYVKNNYHHTLVALALGVALTVTLLGCNPNPAVVQRKPAASTSPTAETPPAEGTTVANDDGTYSLKFSLPDESAAASRSLINYDTIDAHVAAIDYYQLVLVDDTDLTKIWASDSAVKTGESTGYLSVVVRLGVTYHILFLHGLKTGTADPVLLSSGYLKYRVGDAVSLGIPVVIRMVPVLLDATITKANTPDAPWASIGNVAWVKDENFDVTLKLHSRFGTQESTGAGNKPHGNALWPLILAQERGTPALWNQFMAVRRT
jgi:hypothetical protein